MTLRRLPVRSARVILSSGEVIASHSVQCPRRGRATSFERCCGCAHKQSIDVDSDGHHGVVECEDGGAGALPNGRIDVAESAVRVRLGDILGADTTCVRADVALEEAREQLAGERASTRAMPVVDESMRLVGILSRTDLIRHDGKRKRRRKNAPRETVAEVMTPLVHGLPEDAPVAYAISLMAFDQLHEVPVVDTGGKVLGMLTSTDALRWVAGALGYVVPERQASL